MPTSLSRTLRFAVALAASSPVLAQEDGPRIGGSFLETFEAPRLDRDRWFVADGWVNTPDYDCAWSADALRKEDGRLELRILRRPTPERDFVCADVQSTAVFGHGVYEARLRAADADGTMSAFYIYTGPYYDDPHDEIDLELPGARTGTVELNSWVEGSDGNGPRVVDLGFDASEGFHDYALEWAPDAIRWYVDGEQVGEITDPARIPTNPGKIFIDLYSGRGAYEPWLGRFEETERTPTMLVERVAYTAPGDPCQFPESIVCGRAR